MKKHLPLLRGVLESENISTITSRKVGKKEYFFQSCNDVLEKKGKRKTYRPTKGEKQLRNAN